jgi:hypothetical protein
VIVVKPSATLIAWALAALASALLVPAALGATRPDDKAGQLGVGAVAVATEVTHPNDVGGTLGVGRVALESQPAYWRGERDYGLYTPAGDVAVPAVVPVAAAEPSGWAWGDYLVPVAAVALVVLLVGGIATATGHGPHRPHRTAPH